jgi:high affinity sulfate transporter 1
VSRRPNAAEVRRDARRPWLPAATWLRDYDASWLRADFVAGFTLAAYLLPAGIGDASLAGLPPEAGLYACLFSGLVFWAFCSSRHTAITVTSAISLLIGSTLGDFAGGDAARYAALASATALIVAVLALLTFLVRGGAVTSFVSETVMVGFKTGVALHLASTQLPKLFGFTGGHGNFWQRMTHFFSKLNETNGMALLIGFAALVVLILGKRFLPNRPVALAVVVGAILLASAADLGSRGVKLLGEVPQGLPALGLPAVHGEDINTLLPLAMACFLLGAVETTAIGRMFALKHGYRLDPNQEFLALSAANFAAGLGRGFPVSGGMSQSLVNESAGARTSLSGLIAAVIILLVSMFLSGLLRYLPQPVLAAVVLVAVAGLLKLDAMKQLWRFSPAEFAVAAAALLGVLTSGLLRGVLIGAVLSLLILLRRGSRPQTTELGRVPGTAYFGDRIRRPENQREPQVFVFRVTGAILYFNVEHVRDRFFELLNNRDEETRLAILFLGTTPIIDLAGAELLVELRHSLHKRGIEFKLADVLSNVHETLVRAGVETEFGPVVANQHVAAVIRAWQVREHAAP